MRVIRKNRLALCVALGSMIIVASLAWSHCQVPCGIYGDKARFETIGEHIATIEKSIKEIEELSSQAKPNMNQIVRWVNNKENHADEIAEIVTYYFMAQRVKLPPRNDANASKEYVKKLTVLHQILVYSMKAKQSTDMANVERLQAGLAEFYDVYYGKGEEG